MTGVMGGRSAAGRGRPLRDDLGAARPRPSVGWLVAALILDVVLVLLLVQKEVPLSWGLVLFVWFNAFLYSIAALKRRAFLAGFLVAFFIFLLSRATLERVFDFASPTVDVSDLETISPMLLLAMGGILVGYAIARARRDPEAPAELAPDSQRVSSSVSREDVRRGALIIYYCTLPFAVFSVIQSIGFVAGASYAALYTSDYVERTSGLAGGLLQYAHEIALVAFVVYLATFPTFRSARLPVFLWIAYTGSFMLTGRRRDVAVLLLFVACYAITRNRITPDDPWLTRKRVWVVVAIIPFVAIIFAGLEAWRGVGDADAGFSFDALPGFFYGQGVSVTVLQNVANYGHHLPDQSYLLEFARTGFLPRLLGFPVLEGNSEARALTGGSLSHSLSWVVLGPNAYMAGLSTGTSFIAEAFVGFGLAGCAAIGFVYGLLLAWLDRLGRGGIAVNIVRLLMAQPILWSPRGSSTGFIQTLIAPSTLAGLAAIMLLAAVGSTRRGRRIRAGAQS